MTLKQGSIRGTKEGVLGVLKNIVYLCAKGVLKRGTKRGIYITTLYIYTPFGSTHVLYPFTMGKT